MFKLRIKFKLLKPDFILNFLKRTSKHKEKTHNTVWSCVECNAWLFEAKEGCVYAHGKVGWRFNTE